MKLLATFFLFLAFTAVIHAQQTDDVCKKDTKNAVLNFRSVTGHVPKDCTNFTWVYVTANTTDTFYAKFSNFNLTGIFDAVHINTTNSSWSFTSTSQYADDYMITNSNEIEIQLFTENGNHDTIFTLDLNAQACGGKFSNKGKISCKSPEKSGWKFYQLTAPPKQQVVVSINSLDDNETVEFYEGYNNKTHPLASFTKSSPRYKIFSEGNALLISVFSSKAKSNFSAEFYSDPDNTNFISQTTNGIWELVNVKPKLNYTWLINPSVSDSDVISININRFNAMPNDTLIISEGLAYKPILILNESLNSQRSFYISGKSGVRVDLVKSKVSNSGVSVSIMYDVVKDCNRAFESAPDSIQSPGYDSQYFYNAKCQWSIANKGLKAYRFSVNDYDTSSTDSLSYDYDKKSTVINQLTDDIVFNQSATFDWKSIINTTSIKKSHRGFLLNFKTYDDGFPIVVPEHSSQSLKVAAVKKPYKGFWTVNAPHKSEEVNNIEFTITTKAKTLPLTIYDGGNSQANKLSFTIQDGKYSGISRFNKLMLEIIAEKEIPDFEISFTNHLCSEPEQCKETKICMHRDWLCDGKNNCGDWSDEMFCNNSDINCGSKDPIYLEHNSTKLQLNTSPVGNDMNCLWTIYTLPNQTLVGLFGDQSLNNTLEMITISDGVNETTAVKIMELTSDSPNTQDYILTKSNTTYVRFVSFNATKPSNFTLNVSAQAIGQRITSDKNVTIPPKLNGSNIMFEVEMPNDQQVSFLFEPDKKAAADWSLKVYDGFSVNQLPLAELKSGAVIYPVLSTANRMLIKAINFKDTNSGNLLIKQIPIGTNFINQTDAGSLYLTSVTPALYTWRIKPQSVKNDKPINAVITLKLNQLRLLEKDFLVIRKDDDRSKIVAQFHSSVNSPKLFHIPISSGVYIEYNSSHKISADADTIFSASYEVLPSCKQEIKLDNYNPHVITSPGYPNIYPISANCNWNISVPKDKIIHIMFNDFNLNEKHPLITYANTSIVLNSSGSVLPDDLILNKTVYIRWSSALYNETDSLGRGFSFTVRMLDCGGNITSTSGTFNTTDYPAEVNKTLHCGWAATVPMYGKKYPNIVKFNVTPKEHPNLVIYNGRSSHSPFVNNASDNSVSLTNTVLFFYTFDAKNESEDADPKNAVKVTFEVYACNQTCNNTKLCMQDEWICNGINDCGDNSDEINCINPSTTTPKPTTPKPTPEPKCPGCGAGWIILSVIIGLIIGALLAIGIPILYRRYSGGGGNYQRFSEPET